MMKKSQSLTRGRLFCIPRHNCLDSAAVTQARSLWLVWSDVAMNRVITRIQKIDSAVILPMPAGLRKGERVLDISNCSDLENTIIRWRARDLVICGHSVRREGELTVGKEALLDRVRRSTALNQLCRTALLNQLQILREEPSVGRRIGSGELTLHGLFYNVESDTFARYNEETGEFQALDAV